MVTVLLACLTLAACGDDDSEADAASTSTAPAPADAAEPGGGEAGDDPAAAAAAGPDDSGSAGEGGPAVPEAQPVAVWDQHEAGEDCRCADGGEFRYFSRTADPDRVVLYFQGGGACFSAATCDFEDGSYSTTPGGPSGQEDGRGRGIFDFANEDNPLRDWSFVYVPYCTGDVHIGNNVHRYTDDLEVNHVGFVNASHGVDHVVAEFAGATQVLVTGSSAGGVPTPMAAGLLSDLLPGDPVISVLADASGAYPSNPPVNAGIGALWGTMNNIPDWPVNEGLTAEEWSIPALFTQAGLHDPDIRMARYDNAYDSVQRDFSALSELSTGDQLDVLLGNEASIEEAGVDIAGYVAAGEDHTILGDPDFYVLETEGVAFLDWFTRFVNGEDVGDVRCVECDPPDAGGPQPAS